MIYEGSTIFRISNRRQEVLDELIVAINEKTKCTIAYFSMIAWLTIRLNIINVFFIQIISFSYIMIFVPVEEMNIISLELFVGIITIIMGDSLEALIKYNLLEREMQGLEKCDNLLNIKPEKGYMNIDGEIEQLMKDDDALPNEFLPNHQTNNLFTGKYEINDINNLDFNTSFLNKGYIKIINLNARYPQ